MKKIIEKLEEGIKVSESIEPKDWGLFISTPDAKQLLEALKEKPFVGCDTCNYWKQEYIRDSIGLCRKTRISIFDKITYNYQSCVHHSKRYNQ